MVAILGSGIAGLTAALELAEKDIDFEVFEASDHVGGKMRSEWIEGFLIEHGPHSINSTSPLLERVIKKCGLNYHRIFADISATKRFIVRKNRPVAFPQNPRELLQSNFFSLTTKLKFAREPLKGKSKIGTDETVAQFFERRLGKEVLNYAADPFVNGLYAGDPEQLSIKHAFPSFYAMEDSHGSLLRGFISDSIKNSADTQQKAFSFTHGVQMLPAAISEKFHDSIHTSSRIRAIIPIGNRWRLDIARGNHEETRHFDAVISTIPLSDLSELKLEVDLDLRPLSTVLYPPVRVIAMGFAREDIDHPLDGYGLLVPGCENSKRILETIFTSTVFPGHAPAGKTLLTTLVGGTRHADLHKLPDNILEELVLTDLDELLGVYGDPILIRHIQWEKAIPQYHLGYGVVKALLNNLEAIHPGLYFAGNYRQGVTITEAMQSGYEASQSVLKFIN